MWRLYKIKYSHVSIRYVEWITAKSITDAIDTFLDAMQESESIEITSVKLMDVNVLVGRDIQL
jgi:hypothetical protein